MNRIMEERYFRFCKVNFDEDFDLDWQNMKILILFFYISLFV